MKSAKEMFEELGYEKDTFLQSDIMFSKTIIKEEFNVKYRVIIFFEKYSKNVALSTFDYNEPCNECIVEPPTFKAIVKQCEELGWLDE